MLVITRKPDRNTGRCAASIVNFYDGPKKILTLTVKEVYPGVGALITISSSQDAHLMRIGEIMYVASDMSITLLAAKGVQARIGINAPRYISIERADAVIRHSEAA